MPRLRFHNFTTHYQQAGTGPDVILVHAFTSNQAVWLLTNIVDALSQDFRVTTYDLRGHGASEVVPEGYDSQQMAEDLRALHEALELEPAYLVGHSYGGVIAVHAALLDPQRFRGVILSDTYFPGLRHLEPDMGQAGPWQDLRTTWLQAGIDIGPCVDFERLFQLVAQLTPEQHATMKRELGPPGYRWLSQIAQLAGTSAARDAFSEAGLSAERICSLQQPLVALYDEHSPFNATCDFLKQHLKSCAVEIVPGAKHLAPVQNPAAFAKLVREHLHQMVTACTS